MQSKRSPVQADGKRRKSGERHSPGSAPDVKPKADAPESDIEPFFTLHAGPWPIEFRLDEENKSQRIIVDGGSNTAVIAAGMPDYMRLQWVLHALAHTWQSHMGLPQTEEDWCDMMASFAASVARDLVREGMLKLGEPHSICPLDPRMFGQLEPGKKVH